MAASRDIKAGRAAIQIIANDKQVSTALSRAQLKLKSFAAYAGKVGKGLALGGVGIVSPLIKSSKIFADMGDTTAKMAKRTGFSVEALSQLQYVSSQCGADIDSLEGGLRRMQKSVYDAGLGLATGASALGGAFRDMGISYKDLQGLKPEAQFELMAERIKKIADPTKKAAVAMTVFGRSGTKLLPMMNLGAKGIKAMRQQADGLKLTISGKDAEAAEVYTDALDRLWRVIKMGVFRAGAAAAPLLTDISQRMLEAAISANDWIDRNRELVRSVLKVGGVVTGIGAGIFAAATAINALSFSLGAASKACGGLLTVKKALGVAIGVTSKAFVAVGAAMAALPTTWLIGAFVGIGAAAAGVVYWLGKQKNYIAQTTAAMQELRQAGDQARQEDLLRIKRLQQLSEKQKLNNQEQKEAMRLLSALEGRYGDLGLSINQATGALEGMSEAQEKLNKVMREAAISEIEAEVLELQNNMKERHKEVSSLGSQRRSIWDIATGKDDARVDKQKSLMRENDADFKRLQAAQMRLKAMRDSTNISSERLTGKGESEILQEKIAANNSPTEHYTNAVPYSLMGTDGAEAAIQIFPSLEDAAADYSGAGEAIDLQRQLADTISNIEHNRAKSAEDERIDTALDEDKASGMALLQRLLFQAETAAEQARAEALRQLKNANADGQITTDERSGIEAAIGEISGSESRVDELMAKLKSVGENFSVDDYSPSARMEAKGGFNASNMLAFTAGGAGDAVANNTATMIKEQKKTNRRLENINRGGLTFS